MVDSHAHLADKPTVDNIDNIIREFHQLGGVHILNSSSTIQTSLDNINIGRKFSTIFPNMIYTSVGVHPIHYISMETDPLDLEREWSRTLLEIVDKFKSDKQAIGESGLDYYQYSTMNLPKDTESLIDEAQKLSFAKHLEIAANNNLGITIHCRDVKQSDRAVTNTLEIVSQHVKGIRGSMHSYTGSPAFVSDIVSLGLMIGFNAICTYKNAESVRDIIRETPIDSILLETDSPYLFLRDNEHKKESKPSDIIIVAELIASIKNKSVDYIKKATTENFVRTFS